MAQPRRRPSVITSKSRLTKEERKRSLKVGLSAVGGGFVAGGGSNYAINLGKEVFEREHGRQSRRLRTSRRGTLQRIVNQGSMSTTGRGRRKRTQTDFFKQQEFKKTSAYRRAKSYVTHRYAPVGLELKKRYHRAKSFLLGSRNFIPAPAAKTPKPSFS